MKKKPINLTSNTHNHILSKWYFHFLIFVVLTLSYDFDHKVIYSHHDDEVLKKLKWLRKKQKILTLLLSTFNMIYSMNYALISLFVDVYSCSYGNNNLL